MSKRNAFITAALAALASAASGGAAWGQAAPTTTTWNGAPETREGDMRFKLRGRLQYDILSSDFDAGADDGTRSFVRRAFLGAQGRLTEHWRYKVDFILNPGAADASGSPASGGGEDVGVDDAYLEYAGNFFSFVVGEHNIATPLEDRTSSLDIPFNERSSFINAFGYGRLAGIGFLTTGANWMGAVSVQGDSLNNQDTNFSLDEAITYSGRFTWAPLFESTPDGYTLLHLGVSGRYRYFSDDAAFRYRSRPLNGRGARPLDVGSGAGVLGERDTTFGVELAGQYQSFGFSAEYALLNGEVAGTPVVPNGPEYDFNGGYVDVYWSPTGEPRAYRGNQGTFGPVSPRRPVNAGGPGHWMVSARYDFLDLSGLGAGASRGEQTSWAVGLDWAPIEHVKFKLNYALSDFELVAAPDETAQIISLRTQFDF